MTRTADKQISAKSLKKIVTSVVPRKLIIVLYWQVMASQIETPSVLPRVQKASSLIRDQ